MGQPYGVSAALRIAARHYDKQDKPHLLQLENFMLPISENRQ